MTTSAGTAQTENEHQCEDEIIDIPLLLESTAQRVKYGIYTDWSSCCICRVPRKLRSVKDAADTPQIVSMGPFHHGKLKLKAMESLKSRYLEEFCIRTGKRRNDLKSIIDGDCEKSIRACYAGNFELKSDFVDMIVTDAAFIIELLLRSSQSKGDKSDDYILSKPWLSKSVEQDLILLENQLPFFVLEKIYDFAQPAISKTNKEAGQKNNEYCRTEDKQNSYPPFLILTCDYFSRYHFKYAGNIQQVKHFAGNIQQVKHFTDLLRCYFCPPDPKEQPGENRIKSLRRATKLDEAGMVCKAVKDTHLSNIELESGWCLKHCPCCNCSWLLTCLPCFDLVPWLKREQPTLKLPYVEVDDTMECVFRNLMALEQCHYPKQVYICNYVSFMDKLINTREDVDLLVEKGVLVSFLGSSKEMAKLFNKLCEQIVEPNSCHYDRVQKINDHCKKHLNRVMATMTSVYFRDFWRGTATIVGIVVLGLTLWNNLLRHILK